MRMMLCCSLLASTLVVAAASPAELARAAAADLATRPPHEQATTRYLSYADKEQAIACSYLLNAVSRSRVVIRPQHLPGKLLRINLLDLANPRDPQSIEQLVAAWEKLVELDPYFHLRTQVAITGSSTGKPLNGSAAGAPVSADAEIKTVTVDGGWIPADVAAALRTTAKTGGAILRADYFVGRVGQAADYYRFAGVPEKEEQLLRLLGVDRKVIADLAADTAANLFISAVTHKPRRIKHLPGPLGAVWFTLDVERVTPERDPLRNPINFDDGVHGKQQFVYDASEWFAQKANKFWLVAVFNSAGERQDTVADRIAKDTEGLDGIVQPIVGCIRCHELRGGQGGLQPFTDDQAPLLGGEKGTASSFRPDVAQRLGEIYDPARLALEMPRDREDYEAAVKRATGQTARDAAASLSATFKRFIEHPVTREDAAAELGLPDGAAFDRLTAQSHDPAALKLRAGEEITRGTFEASFAELAVAAAGAAGQEQ